MAISYKTLYQEAQQQVKELTDELRRLRNAVAADPDERLRELARTGEVVDLAGIARHMHVDRFTPQQWRQRYRDPQEHDGVVFPPVDFPEIKEPLWYASTIRDGFARPTRRLWCETPTSVYAAGCSVPHQIQLAA